MATPGFIEKNKPLLKIILISIIVVVGSGIILFLVLNKPDDTVSGGKTSEDDTTPDNTTPDNTTPDNTTPDDTTPCKIGQLFEEPDSCSDCGLGYYSSNGIDCDMSCDGGYYLDRSYINPTCIPCSWGSYNDEKHKEATFGSNQTVCKSCGVGKIANSSSAATSCIECPAGTFQPTAFWGSSNIECKKCPDGSYSSTKASSSCSSCEEGQMPNQDKTACVNDPNYVKKEEEIINSCSSVGEPDTPEGCDRWALVDDVMNKIKIGDDLDSAIASLQKAADESHVGHLTIIKKYYEGQMETRQFELIRHIIRVYHAQGENKVTDKPTRRPPRHL
jgi:hypothetical protein